MRQGRVKVDPRQFDAVYHCLSRVVGAERLLDRQAKEVFRKMLWDVAEFCGIEVLTYLILCNHFHIYVFVPKRTPITDEELLRRYAILHPKPTKHETRQLNIIKAQLATNGPAARKFRRRMRKLMNNVSNYMKLLKQRFTIWYNKNHYIRGKNRIGTLWDGRFKSHLNEITPVVNSFVGAYIDLNSVRAGLVADPKDYRFSGYAEAIAGNQKARKGIMFLTGLPNWDLASARYRQVLFTTGSVTKEHGGRISRDQLEEVIRQGGQLPLETLLRCRNRFFTDGLILGSAAFVQAHLDLCRKGLKKDRQVQPIPWVIDGETLAIPKRMRGQVVFV